jgi:tetratricopeptide (TPR) repeat protein
MLRLPHLALALLTGLCGACQSGPKTELDPERQLENYRDTALTHYENGDLLRAEGQALKGLAIDDEDKTLRLMLGWILLRRGDVQSLERAEWVFREYLDDYEGEQRATLGLAGALERLGAVRHQAAGALRRGERLPDRGSPEARADELVEEGRENWEEALALYRAAHEKRDDDTDALDGLQRVAARLGDLEQSLEWSNELIERAELEREWYRGRLESVELASREESRLRAGERAAIRLLADTHLFANAQLVTLGRLEEALGHLDAAIALDPEAAGAYSRRAQLRYLLGDFGGAQADIERFISRSDQPADSPDMRRAFALLDFAERADPSLEWVASIVREE